jgi:hypothetical protein
MISTRHERSPTLGKNATDWLTPGHFAALLGLLILVCFFRVVVGLETFASGDFSAFGYPLAFYHRESFWRGALPFWNPYNNCGMPFLAQWNTLTLYPLSLFYLLFPLSWSLGMFCLGHLFLAGMGTYFLAHRWTGSRLGAALAGVVFAFNGLIWRALLWPNNIAALGWMPWVVLAVEEAWRQGGRAVILAALAGAMQMLTGAPEIILQTWFVVGALWVMEIFRGEISRTRILGRGVIVGSLVAGLAAAQLLPFLDLLAHSQRDVNYGDAYGDASWAMPSYGWANFLVPLFHCWPNHLTGVFFQINQNWISSYYLGAAVMGLALLALWRARQWRVWLLGALVLLSLNLALGENGWAYKALKEIVPQVGFMRFPIKFVVIAVFALPLLAAYGVAWLDGLPAETWAREWKRFGGLALGLLAAMAVILWFAIKYPLPTDDFTWTLKNTCVRALFMILIFCCLTLSRLDARSNSARWLRMALVPLLWFDVFTHAPANCSTAARRVYEPDSIRLYFNWKDKLRPGISRAMQSKASINGMILHAIENSENDANGRRLALFLNYNLLDHASKLDGFYSLDLREIHDVINWMYSTNENPTLQDFLGISHLSNPTNIVDWIPRQSFLPLVTAGQKPVFADKTNTFNNLVGSFEPQRTLYLPLEIRGQVHATNQVSAKILSPQFLSPQRLRLKVEADAPAMVVVAQAFYHPWRAYVDGARVPLWRANYAFQALEVPVGQHEVNLVYEDRNFHYGLVLSLSSLLICGALWFAWRKSSVKISTAFTQPLPSI